MPETPPPYGMPPKKSGNPLIWVFVAIVAFCCLAVIGGGALIFATARQGGAMLPCMMTTSAALNGITKYAEEKGTYPDADKWQEQISPYYLEAQKKMQAEFEKEGKDVPFGIDKWFRMSDITAPLACSEDGVKTWLSYNSDVSGKKVEDIKEPGKTVVLFESTVEKLNASAPYKKMDSKGSPKVMGQNRGWWLGYADGEIGSTEENSKTKMDFEF